MKNYQKDTKALMSKTEILNLKPEALKKYNYVYLKNTAYKNYNYNWLH